ncbi:MAG: response regulator [Deltaproteobacteria bacterium]|nr:response regulator [Deltaproteobacteria bacterium]
MKSKESAIKQLEESLTAKIQDQEHKFTEKEDLTGLLEQRTAEITNLRMAKKKTIMVVDDNPDIVTVVKTLLEVKGYKVQSAYSGQEVFNLLAKQKSDLIILDIMMPRMDGLEVLTRLKGDSNTRPIPVVLLTAKQPDEAILGGYDIWADSYITKPFTNTQLLNVINRLIGEA